jgi:hypothetical protein
MACSDEEDGEDKDDGMGGPANKPEFSEGLQLVGALPWGIDLDW